MSIDTPASIAVLGAGPIGLEAALYARFLGYDVSLYEQGSIAHNMQRWGHVRMFSPFAMNASPLGLAAIRAQDESYVIPASDTLLTGTEFFEQYLRPLSETDLLADNIHQQTRVRYVGRAGIQKSHPIGHEGRVDAEFEIVLENQAGETRTTADVVVDATGTYDQPCWLGANGIPACGEIGLKHDIAYHLPDILRSDRSRYADKHVLVVGGGYSAATAIVALSSLSQEAPETRTTWVTRGSRNEPIVEIADDPLPARAELTQRANELAAAGNAMSHRPNAAIQSITRTEGGQISIRFAGKESEQLNVDEVIALVGYRPDRELSRELQVHECFATEGPMGLAASLLKNPSSDCLQQSPAGIEALLTTEPRYFVLGSKSYGRNSNFLLSAGRDQVRQIFSFLGDRDDLDLYRNLAHLLA